MFLEIFTKCKNIFRYKGKTIYTICSEFKIKANIKYSNCVY